MRAEMPNFLADPAPGPGVSPTRAAGDHRGGGGAAGEEQE